MTSDRTPRHLASVRREQVAASRAQFEQGLARMRDEGMHVASVTQLAEYTGLSERTLRRKNLRPLVERALGRPAASDKPSSSPVNLDAALAEERERRYMEKIESLRSQLTSCREDNRALRIRLARTEARAREEIAAMTGI